MARAGSTRAWEWLINRRAVARWTRSAAQAGMTSPARLRQQRTAAQQLRPALDRVIAVADDRLGLPRIASTAFARPAGTDWSWRPPLWHSPLSGDAAGRTFVSPANNTNLGPDIKIFHDCPANEMILSQRRNLDTQALAPYTLGVEIFAFHGSFLSLALDLPPEALAGLGTRHLVRMDLTVEHERPLNMLLRLNVQHGPNIAQLSQNLPHGEGTGRTVEFDLGYEKLNEKRIEKAWVDLIFDQPRMNRVLLQDITFARYPRAPL